MKPAPGDLVILDVTKIAWAEVHDRVYEFPDTSSEQRAGKVQVLSGEHGIVRRTLGLVAFVFWAGEGKVAILQADQLVVVARPLPSADLTRAFRSLTG